MKYLLLLSLICTNFVMGQEYDKGFIAKKINKEGRLTLRQIGDLFKQHHAIGLYKILRKAIKPDSFDKKIAQQFYEHIEQCDPFVRYRSDSNDAPLRKGNKKSLKNCLKNLDRNGFETIQYKITPESPLYIIINDKYNEQMNEIYDDEGKIKDYKKYDNLGWITYNTHCSLIDINFSCKSTFLARDYLKIIEEFEKKQ